MTDQTTEDPRRIEWVPLDEIQEDPTNPKAHADELIDASIGRHGVIDLMTRDDRTGYLISGHGRLHTIRARREAGATPPPGVRQATDGRWLVPVVVGWSSTDDLDAQAALITLNRSTELGGWVDDSLLTMLDQLAEAERLDGVGFDTDDIEALRGRLAALDTEQLTDPDDAPPLPVTPISQDGDLWLLGAHRLVVGDATTASTYEQLLTGDLVRCVWTDPPYGVSYQSSMSVGEARRRNRRTDGLEIANDTLTDEALRSLLRASFSAALQGCEPGAAWYVASPSGERLLDFAMVLHEFSLLRHTLAWVKDQLVLGRGDYHYRHETIFYGWKPGAAHHPVPDRTQDSVWEIPRPQRSTEHPTMKPVELVARALRNSTGPGDLVLDPFAGSGTTLIAAHQEGRRARLIELDPRYADVICRRYQEHTGIKPTRDGEPYDFTA